jgi:adenylylsulfate kinase-like enzyme
MAHSAQSTNYTRSCECAHPYHDQVIIWLNGTFGCGKTSTAAELHSLVRSSRVFDPETVGYMLQPNLADQPVSDFQHWPPWRPLVVATVQRRRHRR